MRSSIAPEICYDIDSLPGRLGKFSVGWDSYGAVEDSQPCF